MHRGNSTYCAHTKSSFMVVESESPVYSRTVQQPAASRLQSCTRHSRRRTLFGVTRRSTAATWCCMPPPRRGPNRDCSTPYWRARVGPKPEGGDALKAWKKECRRQTQVLSRAGLLLVPLSLSPTPSLVCAPSLLRGSPLHTGTLQSDQPMDSGKKSSVLNQCDARYE